MTSNVMLELQALGVEITEDERQFVRPYLAGGIKAYERLYNII